MRDDKGGGRGTGTVKDVGEEDSQVTVGEGERVRFVRKDFRWVEVDSSTQSDQPLLEMRRGKRNERGCWNKNGWGW